MTSLRRAIDSAAELLAEAGIDSARCDAEQLAAHVAGADRGRLTLIESPGDEFFGRFRDVIVGALAAGAVAASHRDGGVRAGAAAGRPRCVHPAARDRSHLGVGHRAAPGSAAGDCRCVHRIGGAGGGAGPAPARGPNHRHRRLRCSAGIRAPQRQGGAVELVHADVTATGLLSELDGQVDLVVANPPYVPDGAILEPEVAQHDPHHAVFGGPDGMALISAVVAHAGRWLRPGGLFAVEHDDTTSAQTVELIQRTGLFDDVVGRQDLAGRPRFVTARRKSGHG